MSKMESFFIKIIILWILVFSIFAERVFLNVATGGKGVLQIFAIFSPFLALLILIIWKGSSLYFLKKKKFIIYFLPYISLTILLPFLGFIFHDYPIRTTFSAIVGINALAFVSIGYWFSTRKDNKENKLISLEKFLIISIVIQFLYALGQYAYLSGYIGALWQPFHEWDLNTTLAAGVGMVYSRSSGLFLNPNILGFWSVISFWLATMLITKKKWRLSSQLLCVAILLFSQSRGAISALLVSYIFIFTITFFKNFNVIHPLRTLVKIPFFIFGGYLILSTSKDSTFMDRVVSAMNIFSQGSSADVNFNTRTMVWNEALNWFPNYPLGTFGSPEFLFESFVDNDWVRIFLQGGIIYALSFLLMLVGSVLLVNYSKAGRFVAVSAIVIGVCGITQTPLAYIPMTLFWFFVGVVAGENKGNQKINSSNRNYEAA